jgi:RNA polymerase sigma-70 factor (ECF subfamily)
MARGDQQAMGELYDLTSGLIHGVTLRILENAHDAEEVVLDVYMKAWRNASSYSDQRGSVTAWLVMMARSVAIDRIRSRNAQPRTLDLGGLEAPLQVATTATPEETTAQNQWRRRIQSAMGELPLEQREALMLAFFGGLSHAELADRLQLPLGTIKTRIRLGLRRLRTLLGENAALA